ncbi:PaaI family thioesterase [Henriciella sp.]|uniref:PaaI family thioesterase n=1 Tax=Henriciella sp. TaxID=1968823 RepID=UPI0026359064|nr:PaaI family thioesterase [Henriciella sp.]
MSVETDLDQFSPHFRPFIEGITTGNWPNKPKGLQKLGIMPEHWLKSIEPGHVRYVWPNDGSHDIQPNRTFGGWVGALSDHVVSICMFSALADGEAFTTQDLQIKLFRPVSQGDITIEARVINRSRSTGYVEAEWKNADGKLLVKVIAWKAIRTVEAIHGPR